ncbi:MAG: helix-turn-helix domain-containing protein [Spirochaetota bacterium]
MQEKIKEIASRVRELRDISGVSVQDMAGKLNLPVDGYCAYEKGEDDIPASVIVEIAQILKVDASLLLTGESPRMNIFSVTRSGKGVSVERRKEYRYQSLASNFVHKKAEPFEVTVEPKPDGTPIHTNSHPGQEMDYLLEGRLKVMIHNNEIILEPGDSIFFDSGYDHGMCALDGKNARFLAIIF